MKISFSINPISDPYSCRIPIDEGIALLKDCDLVFSIKGASAQAREEAKELLGDKYIPLNTIGGSRRITRYITTKVVHYNDELEELETIYQSLPKGVELTLYDVYYFEEKDSPPTIFTIPYEN